MDLLPPRRRFARDREPPDDGGEQLRVSAELESGRAWLRLEGELDLITAPLLRERMRDLERRRPQTLVLDLRALDFLDSSGISELLVARRRGERIGCRMLLATTPGSVTARIVAMTGIDAVMEHVDEIPPERA